MYGFSCKKLIAVLILCCFLTGCATLGIGDKSEPSLSGFLPEGCSTYLAGRMEALPPMLAQMFAQNGIPDLIIDNTSRIYCCFNTPERITVFLEGDYPKLLAKTYFAVKKQYSKHSENSFDYYIDQETGAQFCLPSKKLIIYSEGDMPKLLAAYNPDNYLAAELDGLYTQDIFVFRDNPEIRDLKLKRNYQVYLWANAASGRYTVDSDLCFATEKDAKVASPVVKLFIQNLIKNTNIGAFNTGRPVSMAGNQVQVRSMIVPMDKCDSVFEYFISELNER